jgi:integrase/recombinase XerD
MTGLRSALDDYLSLRRGMGFKLARDEKLLAQFLAYLEAHHATTITIDHCVAWASAPLQASPGWLTFRMSVVRGFATYLHAIDPATEIPPSNLFPARAHRAVPYLYSDAEIDALITAASGLRYPLGVATYRTLIGLLAVTGMRIGEAIRLDVRDLDLDRGLLVVRKSKLGKSRLIPLHPTAVSALGDYLRRRTQLPPRPPVSTPALFVSTAGTRLRYENVSVTFIKLVRRARLRARSASCRPRLHDFRHTLAVRTLLEWYRDGGDVQSRMPLLSTWLGHADPKNTYWYLSAAPELLAEAARRLEKTSRGGPR